jgi:hypothetical protein
MPDDGHALRSTEPDPTIRDVSRGAATGAHGLPPLLVGCALVAGVIIAGNI